MTQDERATATGPDSETDVRSMDTIANDLEKTRAELVDTIDRIVDRVSPKRAVSRWKQAVTDQVDAVKGGEVTPAAVAVAATVVAVVGVVLFRRRRR